ncbi:hypothetical protein HJ590_15480 [Naumannella sp. ID2617S]|nr:hypothetical protein [Naumannella sp. ID2617S]
MFEHRDLAGTDWYHASGPRDQAFAELGKACADRIHRVLASAAVMDPIRDRVERSPHFESVLAASRRTPAHAELVALARGADAPIEDLEILNLRGDLGTDGLGCTDVAIATPTGPVVGHNEDGPADFDCVALTLTLEARTPIWVYWTPGMLPANSFVLTGNGLAHGCDAITVTRPADAPGRHFVARGLADCTGLTEATEYLRSNPSAGGFHHALTDWRAGAYAGVEAVAGQTAELPLRNGICWHTNHLLALDGLDTPGQNSLTRAATAAQWRPPDTDPVEWCLTRLAHTPMPEGVNRGSETLGTIVLDCRPNPAELTLAVAGREIVRRPVTELLAPVSG